MSYPLFPATLPVGFSVTRKPVTATRVARHVSGRSVRRSNYLYPLFAFDLTFEALSSAAAVGGVPAASFQALQGFFADQLGQYGLFRYQDPLNNVTANQLLGIGDGMTTVFPFVWTVGSSAVPVGQVEPSGLSVAVGGATQAPSSYAVGSDGASVVFSAAPASGQSVTASYGWYFLCAFDADSMDFEEFMENLWAARSVKFTSVKL